MNRLQAFLPGFLDKHPVLSRFGRQASIVLYGSTTMGIDDEHADLDLWFLLPAAELARLDDASETRFFEIALDGKKGHLTADSVEDFTRRLGRCEMDMIYQLRGAEVLADPAGAAAGLVQRARRPMPPEVSRALFFYHYVEMRGEHRSCDNPIERGDPVALLLALAKTLTHAMQAAMVLDGQPYPYDKWLHRAAMGTPTGRRLGPAVERILGRLEADALHRKMPQNEHPINVELMAIRHALIESAESKGLRADWLRRWWLHMDQARNAIRDICWSPERPTATDIAEDANETP